MKKKKEPKNPLLDFRNFVFLVWEHLSLPNPTPVQYDMAEYLQNAPKRAVIEAFRGVGKSYITSAFVCHQLLLNPQLNILVVSASKNRADDFSTFTSTNSCSKLITDFFTLVVSPELTVLSKSLTVIGIIIFLNYLLF